MIAAPELFPPDLISMIGEVRREIAYRKSLYPRLVADGKMNPKTADRRIEVMQALLAKLEAERDG